MRYPYKLNSNTAAFIKEAASVSVVAIDVETDASVDQNIMLIQLALDADRIYLWTPEYLPQLKTFLEQKTLIAHNAAFEIAVLKANDIHPKSWIDTYLNESIIVGGGEFKKQLGLDHLVLRYFGVELLKDNAIRLTFGNDILTPAHYNYAAGDVYFLHRIVATQENDPMYNKAVVDLETKFLHVVSEMQTTGFRVDIESWGNLVAEVSADLLEAEADLKQYADINWGSVKQKLQVLQDNGVNINSTAKPVLIKYAHIPIVEKLIRFNNLRSYSSKLGKEFLDKIRDERISTRYTQIVDTGRMSSSGVNLQNIPKDYRRYFLPLKDNNVFVSSDYSAQELVILGYAAGQKQWIDTAAIGGDLHMMCAATLYPAVVEMDEAGQLEMRKKVKAVNLSLAYGTGIASLSSQIGMSFKETQKLVTRYYNNFSDIEEFLTNQSLFAKVNNYTLTLPPFKRRRILNDARLSSTGRKGKNSPIQGTAADMIKLACNMLYDQRSQDNSLQFRFVSVLHDEITLECSKETSENVSQMLQDAMRKAGDIICPTGLIHTDSKINATWS